MPIAVACGFVLRSQLMLVRAERATRRLPLRAFPFALSASMVTFLAIQKASHPTKGREALVVPPSFVADLATSFQVPPAYGYTLSSANGAHSGSAYLFG